MQKLAGLVLTIGALLFFIGVSTPVVLNVFGATDNPRLQVEYIQNDPTGWDLSTAIHGAGSLIAAIGLVLLATQVQSISTNRNVGIASYLGSAMAIVGALFWVIISYNRIVLPPEDIINNDNSNTWMFVTYALLTLIALIIFGFVLLQSGYPKWLGWVVLVLGGLELVAGLALGGLPPGFLYWQVAIMGIALLLLRSRSPQLLPSTT